MNIGELCTREVYIVNPSEPLSQSVHEIRTRNIGCIVAVERRGDRVVPVGIVTDRDIVRALPAPVTAADGDLVGIVAEQLGSLARLVERQTQLTQR